MKGVWGLYLCSIHSFIYVFLCLFLTSYSVITRVKHWKKLPRVTIYLWGDMFYGVVHSRNKTQIHFHFKKDIIGTYSLMNVICGMWFWMWILILWRNKTGLRICWLYWQQLWAIWYLSLEDRGCILLEIEVTHIYIFTISHIKMLSNIKRLFLRSHHQ